MSKTMTVSMILKLIDQLSGPAKGSVKSVREIEQAIEDLNKVKPRRAFEWVEQQNRLKALREELAAVQKQAEQTGGAFDKLAKLNQIMDGAGRIAALGKRAGGPVRDMIARAAEFERQMEELARAAGQNSQRGAFGRSAIALQGRTGVGWEEITKARRAFVEKGGGEGLAQIGKIEERLIKLAYASGTDAAELYKTLFSYMDLVKMAPEQAIRALEVNYAQGKAGAYELKNMVKGMPELIGLGREIGLKGEQITRDLVGYLQILAKMTGSPGEANTRLRHVMQKLTDPKYMQRINKELGIDVSGERKTALANGENWVFRVLNLIADKIGQADPKLVGKVGPKGIEGGDPEKMGAIFKDFYMRSGVNAFIQLRDQLAKFMPSDTEAAKTAITDFASRASTAAAAADRLAHALDRAAIKAGETQLQNKKALDELKKKAADKTTNAMGASPGLTGLGMGLWNWGSGAVQYGAGAAQAALGAGFAWLGYKALAERFPGIGRAGSAIGGAAKSAVKLPFWVTQGLGQGIASEWRGQTGGGVTAAQLARATEFGRSLRNGVLMGVATWAGQKAIDLGFQTATSGKQYPSGYDPKREASMGLVERFNRLLENIGARTPAGPPASPPVSPGMPAPAGWQARAAIDPSSMEAAQSKAVEAGQAIANALNVTAKPNVDASSIDGAIGKLNQLVALLNQAGAAAVRAGVNAQNTARRVSSGALHDGYETR